MKKLIFLISLVLFLNCNDWKPVKFELLNLHANESLSGSFFLGSGNIEGKDYYLGFIKGNNGIKRLRVPSKFCTIFYTKEKPYFETMGLFNGEFPIKPRFKCNLYIPEGSIISNFNLK